MTRKGTLPTLQSATVDVQSLDNEDKEELVRVLRQAVTRNNFVFGPTHFVQSHFVPTTRSLYNISKYLRTSNKKSAARKWNEQFWDEVRLNNIIEAKQEIIRPQRSNAHLLQHHRLRLVERGQYHIL